MDLDYAREKIGRAVEILACSPLPLHERLREAYLSGLNQLRNPRYLPDELQKKVDAIADAVARAVLPVGDEGSLQPSIMMMTDAEASALASKILTLFDEIARLQAQGGM
jgi:hypothetical protein